MATTRTAHRILNIYTNYYAIRFLRTEHMLSNCCCCCCCVLSRMPQFPALKKIKKDTIIEEYYPYLPSSVRPFFVDYTCPVSVSISYYAQILTVFFSLRSSLLNVFVLL